MSGKPEDREVCALTVTLNIFGGKKVWRNRKEKVDKLAVGILSIYETYFTVRLYTHTLSPRAPHTNTHRP